MSSSVRRLLAAAALGRVPLLGVLEQQAPHRDRRDREEVAAALPLDVALVDESFERLVNQRGGLEGVVGALPAQVAAREAPQLVVDERDQRVELAAADRAAQRLVDPRPRVGGVHRPSGEPILAQPSRATGTFGAVVRGHGGTSAGSRRSAEHEEIRRS